jgi:hypothetical protein
MIKTPFDVFVVVLVIVMLWGIGLELVKIRHVLETISAHIGQRQP